MASITSMMNSNYNTSSIYGTRNVLSGLASGMDTETMIENAVSGIKRKIQSLYQKRTKVEWQQEAYRSIIDKAVNLNNKYTSYSSKTNLLSSSFFSNAVLTSAKGTYADKVSASGKTSSDIKINAVKQLATAATYTVSGMGGLSGADFSSITGGENFDIGGTVPVSTVSGSLTFQYGGSNGASFTINFDELEDLNDVTVYNDDGTEKEDATNAEKLAQAIRNKLSEVSYNYTKNGVQESTNAGKAIQVNVDSSGNITFSDGLGNGNSVKISSAAGKIKTEFKLTGSSTSLSKADRDLTTDTDLKDYLKDKTLGFTYNGATKTIDMNDILDKIDFTYDAAEDKNTQFVNALQSEIDKAFGKDKITVGWDGEQGEGGRLSFATKGEGDTLTLGGSAAKALGFEDGDANYINAGKKLSNILGDKADSIFTTANRLAAVGDVTEKTGAAGTYYVDSKGNKVEQAEDGKYYQIDNTGKAIYDFEVNGSHIKVTEDTTLESLMNSINSNADAGVKVSYSKLTNEFRFTATETGSNSRIELGGLAQAMFGSSGSSNDKFSDAYGLGLEDGNGKVVKFGLTNGGGSYEFLVTGDMTMEDIARELNESPLSASGYKASYDERTGQIVMTDGDGKAVDLKITTDGKELKSQSGLSYTAGQDAVMDVEINGKRFENLSRSSNNFDIDGLNITVKDTFNADRSDVDKDGNAIEPVTFETVTDSDKIVDAIRSFVNDYNEMVTELKGAYSTLPGQQTDGSRYEPLTAEQEEKYTESELAAYNEKAKQGILFGDTTLSSMYSKLLNAIAPGGVDGQTLREIGIGTSYENGLTTISLNEDKLRAALDSDPDKVKNAFVKTVEGGSSSDGLMQSIQNTLNTYAKTTGEPKGVLIARAGSIKAPTSLNNNTLNTQIGNIDKEISRWQDKMSSQIDRYTKQFSKLEQLVAQMNSQASALAGLMGGYEGY